MRPDFALSAGGADVTDRIRPLLVELRVTESIDRTSDQVEITLADTAGDLAVPRSGRELKVSMGYDGALAEMGTFAHTESQIDLAPRVVRIRGTAADFRADSALKAPRTRSWDEVTLGGVVSQIAGEHGYQAAVSESLASEAIAHIDQTAESDLHLVRRLAAHYGASAKAAGNRLVLVKSGEPAPESASGSDMPNVRIQAPPASPDALPTITGRVTRTDKSRYGAVRASYNDVEAAELAHVLAGAGMPVYELRNPRPDRAQALADAKAKLASLTRQTRSLTLTVPATPSSQPAARSPRWGGATAPTTPGRSPASSTPSRTTATAPESRPRASPPPSAAGIGQRPTAKNPTGIAPRTTPCSSPFSRF